MNTGRARHRLRRVHHGQVCGSKVSLKTFQTTCRSYIVLISFFNLGFLPPLIAQRLDRGSASPASYPSSIPWGMPARVHATANARDTTSAHTSAAAVSVAS